MKRNYETYLTQASLKSTQGMEWPFYWFLFWNAAVMEYLVHTKEVMLKHAYEED